MYCMQASVVLKEYHFFNPGTAAKIKLVMNGKEQSNPAQVLKVVWRNPIVSQAHPHSFFTVHEQFAPADIVFGERVHLLSITSQAVTFTEVDRDISDVREHPFTFMSQNNFATRLIILPSKKFFSLVDDIDVEDRNVV